MARHLKRLRNEMDKWLVDSKDLGWVPEKELIRQWWNGQDKPPVTAAPQITRSGGQLSISCPTEGASIGYKIQGEDQNWRVYTKPITVPSDKTVTAIAMRIGYTPSAEVTFTDSRRTTSVR